KKVSILFSKKKVGAERKYSFKGKGILQEKGY
ncbi:unnamed protein product, partial [marine sediment metagenome]